MMDRRRFLCTGLGALGSLALVSCGSSAPAPAAGRPTIRLPGGDFGFPSPYAYASGPGYPTMTRIYDTLLLTRFEYGAPVVPWLAERFERAPDDLTYQIELRPGIRWHDGRPLTADDVVFSFEYFAANRQTLPPNLLGAPVGQPQVRATGERTLEIRLEAPDATFERNVAGFFPIVPRHIWSSIDDPGAAQDMPVLIGSGPYRLESYMPGEGAYRYEAYDEFFLGRPYVERIELLPVNDQASALLAGEIDAGDPGGVTGTRPEILAPFRDNPDFRIIEEPPGDFLTALYWNLGRGGALADPVFRRSCAHAIDRDLIIERILGGNGVVGNPGFLPPDHPFHVEVEQYPYDPATANQLLDEAGYGRGPDGIRLAPGGERLQFELLFVPMLAPLAEVLVGMLREVGIQLTTVAGGEFVQLIGALGEGNYQVALFVYGGLLGDPDFMRQVYSPNAPERLFFRAQGYSNPAFEDLAARQRVTFEEDERAELVAQMQRIAADDLPLLHLFYPKSYFIFRRSVFDDWPEADGPNDKQVLVTGRRQGLDIRPSED